MPTKRKKPVAQALSYEQQQARVTEARRAWDEANAGFESRLDQLLRRFTATDPEAAQVYAEILAAEASGDKEAERRAEKEWNARFFDRFMELRGADAEVTRLWHERDAAQHAYVAALGPDDDEEGES